MFSHCEITQRTIHLQFIFKNIQTEKSDIKHSVHVERIKNVFLNNLKMIAWFNLIILKAGFIYKNTLYLKVRKFETTQSI